MEQFFKFYDIFGGNINMNIHGNNINVISNSLPSQNFIKNIDVRKNEYQTQENNIRYFNEHSDLLLNEYYDDEENHLNIKKKRK